MEPPLINLFDYEARAAASMGRSAWDYYRSGSDDMRTLQANREVFQRLSIRPRILVDVSTVDMETTVLGTPIAWPIMVAPTAYHGLANADGECATAKGAGSAGTLMIVSTLANRPLEEVAAAAVGPLWFQLYVHRNRELSESLVRRAEATGYKALVLTVDVPVHGNREPDVRNAFTLPHPLVMGNFDDSMQAVEGDSGLARYISSMFDPSLDWEVIPWLRSITRLPIVLKGVMTAEDTERAAMAGVDAVVVSNHGGRQLDTACATLDVLPEVVRAAAGRLEVYMDGGIRRGTDVFKAIALGARAVLIGRPILWGLAVDGARGVRRVLEILQDELRRAMQLAGCPRLEDVTPRRLRSSDGPLS